jgi:hypothetical protein
MFAMKEYPHDVMPLYSQGYSVARYLVAQGGRQKFLEYLADGMHDNNWSRATQQHYGIASLASLQTTWLDWVRKGSPALDAVAGAPALASTKTSPAPGKRPRPDSNLIHRDPPLEAVAMNDAKAKPRPRDDQPERSVYEMAFAAKDADKPQPAGRDKSETPLPGPSLSAPVDSGADAAEPSDAPPTERPLPGPKAPQRPGQVILQWSRTDADELASGPPGGNRLR